MILLRRRLARDNALRTWNLRGNKGSTTPTLTSHLARDHLWYHISEAI